MPTQTTRLNLTQPDAGNTDWKDDLDAWADKLDQVSAQYITFYAEAVAEDESIIIDGFQFDENVNITKVTLYAREAPTGDSLQIDFLKGQVEQNKKATLNIAANKGSTAIAGLSFLSTEEMGLKFKQVGATIEGGQIQIIVHYNVQPVT